ncbi:MAG: cystathionine beta-synthase [Polyangia bacterium]|jgi:cystathionine beta-synthase
MMKGARANVIDAIGSTPIIKLNKVAAHVASDIYVKCEFLNPGGSMKDRVALNIIQDAERRGLLQPGSTIIEATSGNTGAGLALVAALRGYKCIFVMPDKMSNEKILALRAFGAKVVICPTAVEPDDPRSYYEVTKRLVRETPNSFHSNQYYNPANPEAHYLSTAPEIWRETAGELDVFVAGMGTGGTISGCGRYFKEKKPGFQVVGVDPIGSLYYEYVKTGRMTKPFSYYVEGIGEDFLPGTMNLKIIDQIMRVDDKECFLMTRELVRQEGLFVGGSSGAAVAGAIKYAEQLGEQHKNILVLLPDSAQKYLSKIFDDEWMRSNGFLDEEDPLGTVRDLLAQKRQRAIVAAHKGETLRNVIGLMKEHGISQVPVLDGGRLSGLLSEIDLLNYMLKHSGQMEVTIDELVEADYATVTPETRIQLLKNIFNEAKLVCVLERDDLVGVITKIDLIDYLASKRA